MTAVAIRQQVQREINAQKLPIPKDTKTHEASVRKFKRPDLYNIGDVSGSRFGRAEGALFAYWRDRGTYDQLANYWFQAGQDVDNSLDLLKWLQACNGRKVFAPSAVLFANGGNLGAFYVALRELSTKGKVQILRAKRKIPTPEADPLIITVQRTRKPPVAQPGLVVGDSLTQIFSELTTKSPSPSPSTSFSELITDEGESGDHRNDEADRDEVESSGETEGDDTEQIRCFSGSSFETTGSHDSDELADMVLDEMVHSSAFNTFLNCGMASIVTDSKYIVVYTLDPVSFETPTPFGSPFKAKTDGAAWLHECIDGKFSDSRLPDDDPLYIFEAKASAAAVPLDQHFAECLSFMYRRVVRIMNNGFSLKDLETLAERKDCPPGLFTANLIAFNQIKWEFKYVDFPPKYLIELFGGQNPTGGPDFLHYGIRVRSCDALYLSNPVDCRMILRAHHALNLTCADRVLWIRGARPT